MAISIFSAGALAFANNAAVAPSLGGTSVLNDLAVAFGMISGTSGSTIALPSGYTQDDINGSGSTHVQYAWRKVVGASEANPTLTPSGTVANDIVAGAGLLLRGVDTATPRHAISAAAGAYAGGATITTPALTISNNNCLVLAIVLWYGAGSALGNFNPNSDGNWTITTSFAEQLYSGFALCGQIYSRLQTSAANISASSVSITGSGTFSGIVQIVAYNAAVVATPQPIVPGAKQTFVTETILQF